MNYRKLAFTYLWLWPVLAVAFTVVVDYQASRYRNAAALDMVALHMREHLHQSMELVKRIGVDYLNPNSSEIFDTFDVYVTDKDQKAVSKPRFSTVGSLVSNKAIVRALDKSPGEIEVWMNPSDYRGVPVISVYTSIMVNDQKCAIIAEIDQSEIVDQLSQWWFYSDAMWVAFFAAVGGALLSKSKQGILWSARENEATDSLAIVIKIVGSFPDEGLALADKSGTILMANRWFAKFVGAFSSAEVIGKNVDSFHQDPAKHKQMREGYVSDIFERPVKFVGVDGVERPILRSIVNLEGTHFLVRMRVASADAVVKGCPVNHGEPR